MDVDVKRERSQSEIPNLSMVDGDEPLTELEAGELPMKEEDDEEDMLHALENAIQTAEEHEGKIKQEDKDDDEPLAVYCVSLGSLNRGTFFVHAVARELEAR